MKPSWGDLGCRRLKIWDKLSGWLSRFGPRACTPPFILFGLVLVIKLFKIYIYKVKNFIWTGFCFGHFKHQRVIYTLHGLMNEPTTIRFYKIYIDNIVSITPLCSNSLFFFNFSNSLLSVFIKESFYFYISMDKFYLIFFYYNDDNTLSSKGK